MIEKALTVTYRCRQSELITRAVVSNFIDNSRYKECRALWDTGASSCVISKRIVKDLDLFPIGFGAISTANGITECGKYRISIELPNHIVKNVTAPASDIGDVDLLIGMDLIGDGDFAVSSNPKTGEMKLSYRSPATGVVDFVEQSKKLRSVARAGKKKTRKQERQNRKHGRQ